MAFETLFIHRDGARYHLAMDYFFYIGSFVPGSTAPIVESFFSLGYHIR